VMCEPADELVNDERTQVFVEVPDRLRLGRMFIDSIKFGTRPGCWVCPCPWDAWS
jgi:hypothetical protein